MREPQNCYYGPTEIHSYFPYYADQIFSVIDKKARTTTVAKNNFSQLVTCLKELIYSKSYILFWRHFTEAAGTNNSYILAYYLTHQLLIHTIKAYTISKQSSLTPTNSEQIEMTADERAAITYIGGYIVRQLIRKVTKAGSIHKNEMLYFLFHLLEDPETPIDDADETLQWSITNWSRLIDRGGLLHGSSDFTNLLFCFENITKKYIQMEKENKIPLEKIKDDIQRNCIKNWDECFQLSNTHTEAAKTNLYEHIIKEYINLRGFAHAARWMEIYKYQKQQKISKSKSLRNKLQLQHENEE